MSKPRPLIFSATVLVVLLLTSFGMSALAAGAPSQATTTTVQSNTTTKLLSGCTKLVDDHDNLTNAKGKATKNTFSSPALTKHLISIAKELKSQPGANKLATKLQKSKAGTRGVRQSTSSTTGAQSKAPSNRHVSR